MGWCYQKLIDDSGSNWPDSWEWLLGTISEVQDTAFPRGGEQYPETTWNPASFSPAQKKRG